MHINDLRSYSNWVGKRPYDIREEVRKKGGWKVLFPNRGSKTIPKDISRVRNYFNEYPTSLVLKAGVNKNKNYKTQQCKSQKFYLRDEWLSDFDEEHALTGHEYIDENGRSWYQMVDVAGIYHFAQNMSMSQKKVAYATFWNSPIFKLVCPDQTGGSMEVIIRKKICDRTKAPKTRISNVGQLVKILESDIVNDSINKGSYNFSETTEVCSEQHTARDVNPHVEALGNSSPNVVEKDASNYYINPGKGTLLTNRKFPSIKNQYVPHINSPAGKAETARGLEIERDLFMKAPPGQF